MRGGKRWDINSGMVRGKRRKMESKDRREDKVLSEAKWKRIERQFDLSSRLRITRQIKRWTEASHWGGAQSTRRQSRAAVSNLFHMETPKENRMKGSERTEEEGRASLLTLRRFLFFHVGKLNTGCTFCFHITQGEKIHSSNAQICAQLYDSKYRGYVRTKLGSVNWWNPSMKFTGWWSYTTMILKFCCFISLKKTKQTYFALIQKCQTSSYSCPLWK